MFKLGKKGQMMGSAGVLFSIVLGLLFATILFLGVLIPQTIHYVNNITKGGTANGSTVDTGTTEVVKLLPMVEVFILIGIYVGGGYVGYKKIAG